MERKIPRTILRPNVTRNGRIRLKKTRKYNYEGEYYKVRKNSMVTKNRTCNLFIYTVKQLQTINRTYIATNFKPKKIKENNKDI